MKLVLDSNIIFFALISGNEKYLDIVRMNDVYMPDIVLHELNKYEARIIERAKIKHSDFRLFVRLLFEKVSVIPKFAISPENWHKAYELCRDVDEKDVPFVALSLEFEIPLCTNDKVLYEGLNKKGFNNFVTLETVLRV